MAALFWRLRFTNETVSKVWLSEVEFLDLAGDVISTAGGTPVSSGDEGGYPKTSAFDGVKGAGNGWRSTNSPAWIGMGFEAPKDVNSARVTLAWQPFTGSDTLPLPKDLVLESSDDGAGWVNSGQMWGGSSAPGGVLTSRPPFSIAAFLAPSPGYVQGRTPPKFTNLAMVQSGLHATQDYRHLSPTTGVVSDRVVLLAGGIEVPFVDGRVWLLRLADGYKAWEGWSDATGAYTATGLELGVEYIAVGIDPYRNQKATGAGPVTATLPVP